MNSYDYLLLCTAGAWFSSVVSYLTAEAPAHSYLHLSCQQASSNCSSSSQFGFCLCAKPLILYCMFIVFFLFCLSRPTYNILSHCYCYLQSMWGSTVLHPRAHMNVSAVYLWSNWSHGETWSILQMTMMHSVLGCGSYCPCTFLLFTARNWRCVAKQGHIMEFTASHKIMIVFISSSGSYSNVFMCFSYHSTLPCMSSASGKSVPNTSERGVDAALWDLDLFSSVWLTNERKEVTNRATVLKHAIDFSVLLCTRDHLAGTRFPLSYASLQHSSDAVWWDDAGMQTLSIQQVWFYTTRHPVDISSPDVCIWERHMSLLC